MNFDKEISVIEDENLIKDVPNNNTNKYTVNDDTYIELINCFVRVRNIQPCTLINNNLQQSAQQEYIQRNRISNRPSPNTNGNNGTNILSNIFGRHNTIPNNNNNTNNVSNLNMFPNLYASISLSSNATTNDVLNGISLFDILLNGMLGGYNTQGGLQNDIPLVLEDSELKKLPVLTYEQLLSKVGNIENDSKCCICLESIQPNANSPKKYTVVPCNHYFHTDCIIEHLSKYCYTCPMCRKPCGNYKPKL